MHVRTRCWVLLDPVTNISVYVHTIIVWIQEIITTILIDVSIGCIEQKGVGGSCLESPLFTSPTKNSQTIH